MSERVLMAYRVNESAGEQVKNALSGFGVDLECVHIKMLKESVFDAVTKGRNNYTVILFQYALEERSPLTIEDCDKILTANNKILLIPVLPVDFKGTEYMQKLLDVGVTGALYESDGDMGSIANVILSGGRDRKDAKAYYGIASSAPVSPTPVVATSSGSRASMAQLINYVTQPDGTKNIAQRFDYIKSRVSVGELESIISGLSSEQRMELFECGEGRYDMYLAEEVAVKKAQASKPKLFGLGKKKSVEKTSADIVSEDVSNIEVAQAPQEVSQEIESEKPAGNTKAEAGDKKRIEKVEKVEKAGETGNSVGVSERLSVASRRGEGLKVEVPPPVLNISQLSMTIEVGVGGVCRGVGTTFVCLSMANFLRRNGNKVAVVEQNGSGSFANIYGQFVAKPGNAGNRVPVFTYDGIDFYPYCKYEQFAAKYKNKYDFVVVDFGDELYCTGFFSMSRRLVIGSSSEWKIKSLLDFAEGMREDSGLAGSIGYIITCCGRRQFARVLKTFHKEKDDSVHALSYMDDWRDLDSDIEGTLTAVLGLGNVTKKRRFFR